MPMKRSHIFFLVVVLTITQLACNIFTSPGTPDTFATLNGLYTAAALTQAGSTTSTPGLPLPTTTSAVASGTNLPTPATPVPQSRCDAMEFLGDVTYPDGSTIARNKPFVKTWRIQNIGTCSWTPSYALVFVNGDSMNGVSALALTRNVNPGEAIEVSVTLTAPNKDGTYRGYWKLRNGSGVLFGFGAQADTAFWVKIKVAGSSYIAYSFVANYCDANWGNKNSVLPCPATEGDPKGFVVKLDAPVMENGVIEDEPGLLTSPQDILDGIIVGQYPAFTVQKGDRFLTSVNCQYNSKKCDVIFHLQYKNNGKINTLASWHEVYEGKYYPVDLDLSVLAGETVKFILMVSANGGQNNDNALWLNPHILRQGVQPVSTKTSTPTFTFTPTLTLTYTPTPTPTFTFMPTSTYTPTPTPTFTFTPTHTSTYTPTPTPTYTFTPTP